MEATSIASASASPTSFDDSSTNPPMLNHPNKTHFDHDEVRWDSVHVWTRSRLDFLQEFNYHQNYVLPKLIQEEKERQKQLTTIDFSFKIGRDEPVTTTDPNGTVTEDEPYLSIIVDNNNNGLNRVRNIFDQYQLDCAFMSLNWSLLTSFDLSLRFRWPWTCWAWSMVLWSDLLHFSSQTIGQSRQFLSDETSTTTTATWRHVLVIEWFEETTDLQRSFLQYRWANLWKNRWILPRISSDETAIASSSNPNEQGDPSVNPSTRLNKYRQLARCFFSINCQMEWSSGALVTMNTFSSYEKLSKQPYQKWQLRFCEDFVDFIYQDKDHSDPNCEYIKRLPANFIDKSVIITTSSDGFVLYVQMKGNAIDLISERLRSILEMFFLKTWFRYSTLVAHSKTSSS